MKKNDLFTYIIRIKKSMKLSFLTIFSHHRRINYHCLNFGAKNAALTKKRYVRVYSIHEAIKVGWADGVKINKNYSFTKSRKFKL